MKVALITVAALSLVITGCTASNEDENAPSLASSDPATPTAQQVSDSQTLEEPEVAGPLPLCGVIDQDAAAAVGVNGPYRPLEHRTESGEIESACWSEDESLLITAVRHANPAVRATCVEDAIWSDGFIISPTSYPVEGGSVSIDAESGTTTGGWEVGEYCFTLLLHSDPYLVVGTRVLGTSEAELKDAALPLVESARGLVT